MYKPEKKYKIEIATTPKKGAFVVLFDSKPDDLTKYLFMLMDIKQTKRNYREFEGFTNEAKEFAELMKVCLTIGEYPDKIPYQPSKLVGADAIEDMYHSFATFKYKNEFQQDEEKTILLFEKYETRREGLAGVLARVLYNVGEDSFTVSSRPNKTRAKKLYSDKHFITTVPTPFGFFDVEAFYIDARIKKGESKKEDTVEKNDSHLSDDVETIENDIAIVTEETPVKQVSPEEVTRTMDVSPTSENPVYEPSKDNDTQTSKELLHTVTHGKDVTLDRRINVVQVPPYNSIKEKVSFIQNLEKQRNEENDSNEEKESVQEQSINEKEVHESNFEFLQKLIPDLTEALQNGIEYGESLSEQSRFNKVLIRRTSELENNLVDISLNLVPIKPHLNHEIELSIRLNLEAKEAILTEWALHNNDEVPTEYPEYNQSDFIPLIVQILGDGHMFKLTAELTPTEKSTDKNRKDEGFPIPVKKIFLKKGVIQKNYDDFEQLESWEEGNNWLKAQIIDVDGDNNFFFIIHWENGNKIGSAFELFSSGFHPQFEVQLLQKLAIRFLLYREYAFEGRFKSKKTTSEGKKGDYYEKLKLLDLGSKVEKFSNELKPKIPIVDCKVIGKADIASTDGFGEGLFNKANKKLEFLHLVSSSDETVNLELKWKDGFKLSIKVKFSSIPQKVTSTFWETIIASNSEGETSKKYQVQDDEPLLLRNEIQTETPKHYYKDLLPAYWYSDDTDQSKKVVFEEWTYHLDELAYVLYQTLQSMEDEEENEIIELSKSSPRWEIVLSFLVNYKKLNSSDRNLQLNTISTLINKATVHEHEESKVILMGLLIRVRGGKKTLNHSNILKDLPKARNVSLSQPAKKEVKNESKRIALNKEIEALLEEHGTDHLKYSNSDLEKIAKYSGYGGSKLSEVNKGLLYEYYTPDHIIKLMWGLARKHGYKGGSVLEPSCGTGKFLKYAPKNARIEGYEINKASAQIAKLIYPHADIHHKSFENLFFNGNIYLNGSFRTEPFDLVIGNPPYGSFSGKYAGMGEKKRTKAFTYDQYFLLRGIDLLKTGGLLVFIIPQSFIDNGHKYNSLKQELFAKAEGLESKRLYHGLFEHTEVGTDILVLRKK